MEKVIIMELTSAQHSMLIDWIENNFIPRPSFNNVKTSYGIQYLFEVSENGFYVDNECIKLAIVECGFKVQNKSELNWVFNISQNSPALKK